MIPPRDKVSSYLIWLPFPSSASYATTRENKVANKINPNNFHRTSYMARLKKGKFRKQIKLVEDVIEISWKFFVLDENHKSEAEREEEEGSELKDCS